MRSAPYSLAALREHRRRKEHGESTPPLTLADIPPDAPMEEGIVLGCWDGEAFVRWETWVVNHPASTGTAENEQRHKDNHGS